MLIFGILNMSIGEVMMQDNSDKPLMPLFIHKGFVLAGCFPNSRDVNALKRS